MAKQDNIKVRIDDQNSAERILKRFKRMCESYGIVREYRKRQAYQKPSLVSKEKKKAADKRRRKNELRERYSGGKI